MNIDSPGSIVNVPEEESGREWSSLGGEIFLSSHYYEAHDGSSDAVRPGDQDSYQKNIDYMNRFVDFLDSNSLLDKTMGGSQIKFDVIDLPEVDKFVRNASQRSPRHHGWFGRPTTA